MARGTHVREVPLVIPKDTVDPQGIEVCDLKMDAGDALLFENRIFHTAAPNRSDRTSKVVIYGYAYRWMKPEIYLDPPDPQRLAGPISLPASCSEAIRTSIPSRGPCRNGPKRMEFCRSASRSRSNR